MNLRYSVSNDQYIYWCSEVAREGVRSTKYSKVGFFLILISMILCIKLSTHLADSSSSENKIYLWLLLGSFLGFLVGFFVVIFGMRKTNVMLQIGPEGIQYDLNLRDEDVTLKTNNYTLIYPWTSYLGTSHVRDAYLLQFKPFGGIGIPMSVITEVKEELDKLLNDKRALNN